MHQARWKKWLSYFFEQHIESASSDYNPHLYVSLNRGRYQLCTANAVYSFEDLYDNFYKAFQRLDFEALPGKRVLLLGLGLGSIPQMLEQHFKQSFHYTAVEVDEAVIYLANKYVLSNLQSSIETVCADAAAFLDQTTEQFDLICMDIFLDDVVPSVFESEAFLENLKARLHPRGALLYNRLSVTEKDYSKTKAFFEGVFQPVFPQATYYDVKSNWILINDNGKFK